MSFLKRLTFFAGLALLAAPAFGQTCTVTVPANPLTPAGLQSLYLMNDANSVMTGCDETNAGAAVFVQAVVFDPTGTLCAPTAGSTASICVYNPLVVNASNPTPAAAIVNPLANLGTATSFPTGSVVGLWFGDNGTAVNLTYTDTGAALTADNCVQGLGQFAYCNAVAFYSAVNAAISGGSIKVPALGVGADNQTCPTSRSFGVVDQDQSDNQTTWYVIAGGALAQYNTANAALSGATVLQNPSDEWLVSEWMDAALGCTPWMVPDLTNGNHLVPSMPTNEVQAAMYQKAPIALIPLGDPFTGGTLANVNLYRAGVDQPVATNTTANTTTYCTNLRGVGAQKLVTDSALFKAAASPLPTVGNSLYTTLAARMSGSYQMLNCQALTHQPNPVTITSTDMNGVVTGVTIKPGASGIQ
jgi:hypothetical protein